MIGKLVFSLTISAFLLLLQPVYAGYNDFTVNVPNSQGGYTAVVIKQSGTGYTGPQGEYYSTFPTVSQLQAVYRTGSPSPSPVITYVQPEPQVQRTVTTQVVYQAPVQDDEEAGYDYRPVYQPNIAQEYAPNGPVEDNEKLTFFEFKKKKKSNQPPSNNQSPIKPAVQAKGNPPPSKVAPPPSKGNPPPPKKKDAPDHP